MPHADSRVDGETIFNLFEWKICVQTKQLSCNEHGYFCEPNRKSYHHLRCCYQLKLAVLIFLTMDQHSWYVSLCCIHPHITNKQQKQKT